MALRRRHDKVCWLHFSLRDGIAVIKRPPDGKPGINIEKQDRIKTDKVTVHAENIKR